MFGRHLGFSTESKEGWREKEICTKGVDDRREEGGVRGRGEKKYFFSPFLTHPFPYPLSPKSKSGRLSLVYNANTRSLVRRLLHWFLAELHTTLVVATFE